MSELINFFLLVLAFMVGVVFVGIFIPATIIAAITTWSYLLQVIRKDK